jgi:hypothetical protein
MKAWLCLFLHHKWQRGELHRDEKSPGVYYVEHTCSRCGLIHVAWERYDTAWKLDAPLSS